MRFLLFVLVVQGATFGLAAQKIKSVECRSALGMYCEVNGAMMVTLDDPFYVNANISKLVPYVDRRVIRGLRAVATSDPAEVVFQLRRTRENSADWGAILGGPGLSGVQNVLVSVGTENGPPTDPKTISFTIFHWGDLCFWSGIAVTLLVFSGFMARTGFLRDTDSAWGALSPWSLSRCQAAFWTGIVFLSWLFLYQVTGDYNQFTVHTIVVLGISAATLYSATAIDRSKRKNAAAGNRGASSEAWRAPSNGLAYDLLGGRISIHRAQMVLWTLALGGTFIFEVWRNLAMPEFSPGMLAMMGLSSTIYVGLKVSEDPKS